MPWQSLPPRSAWWIWNGLVWLGIGVFNATQNVFVMRSEGMHHAWVALFVMLTFSWLPWALATPFVLQLGGRYPPRRLRSVSTWAVHLIALGTVAVTTAAWVAALERTLNPWAWSHPPTFLSLWIDRFYNGLLQSLFLYVVILGTSYILDSRHLLLQQETEKIRLSEQLAKAQLSALRRQIEPHFLFNTLNSIAGQVREMKNDAAVEMIAALSDVLRAVIRDSNRQEVSLGEEAELLRKYLEILKVRFRDRLQVELQIPKELSSAMVPSFVLQPLVENAVQHGISKRARGGMIQIAAFRRNGFLTLSVYNDGPILAANWEKDVTGVGLSNVRSRLHSLYGNDCQFRIGNRDASGVEVFVSIPFRET